MVKPKYVSRPNYHSNRLFGRFILTFACWRLQTAQQPKPKAMLMEDVEPDDDSGAEEAGDVDGSDRDDNGDDDDDDGSLSGNAQRSAYVGRGNVKDVRSARRRAGLSEGFALSDPLLREFDDFLRASGCAEKDIRNKVNTNTQVTPNDI